MGMGMGMGMPGMGANMGMDAPGFIPPGQPWLRQDTISPRLIVNNIPGSHESGISAGMKDEDPFADPVAIVRNLPPTANRAESPTIHTAVAAGANVSSASNTGGPVQNPFLSPTEQEAGYDPRRVSAASGPVQVSFSFPGFPWYNWFSLDLPCAARVCYVIVT